jgi:hypothetical protein
VERVARWARSEGDEMCLTGAGRAAMLEGCRWTMVGWDAGGIELWAYTDDTMSLLLREDET